MHVGREILLKMNKRAARLFKTLEYLINGTLIFYLSRHSDFEFFSCVAYLPSKFQIKNIKTLFLDLDLDPWYHVL